MDPELDPCRNPEPRLGCHRVGVEVGVGSSGGGVGGGVVPLQQERWKNRSLAWGQIN